MFRRRIPFNQIALATVLGVAGGIYVYRPIFEPTNKSMSPTTIDKQDANVPQSLDNLEVKADANVKNI